MSAMLTIKGKGYKNGITVKKCTWFTAIIHSEFTVQWGGKKSFEMKAVKQPRTKKKKSINLWRKCFWPLRWTRRLGLHAFTQLFICPYIKSREETEASLNSFYCWTLSHLLSSTQQALLSEAPGLALNICKPRLALLRKWGVEKNGKPWQSKVWKTIKLSAMTETVTHTGLWLTQKQCTVKPRNTAALLFWRWVSATL